MRCLGRLSYWLTTCKVSLARCYPDVIKLRPLWGSQQDSTGKKLGLNSRSAPNITEAYRQTGHRHL